MSKLHDILWETEWYYNYGGDVGLDTDEVDRAKQKIRASLLEMVDNLPAESLTGAEYIPRETIRQKVKEMCQ